MKALHARQRVVDSPKLWSSSLRWASSLHWTSQCGVIGACIYLAGFALPLQWDLPLIGLALFSTLAVVTSSRASAASWSPLALTVVAFLSATALSTLVSEDIGRSVRFGTSFLPAMLLFFVVAEHCAGTRHIRLLYLTLSAVGLGLASTLLWAAWHGPTKDLNALVSSLRIPILIVPNDLTFLAVIAPLSLVLLYREPRGVISICAAASIVLSMCTICIFRSRTAALTMLVSLTCACLLTQRCRRLLLSLAGFLGALLFALSLNALLFPESQLVTKIVNKGGSLGRASYWKTAWRMFREAPLLGHGPHTFGLFHKTPWAHNLYLEVLAEQGILGFIALGVVFTCGVSAAWKLQRTASGDAHIFGTGALAGLLGFCSAAFVELSFLRQWVVITLFALLGVIAQLSSSPAKGVR